MTMTTSQYGNILYKIGSGASGIVYKTDKLYAVKKYDSLHTLIKEVAIFKKLTIQYPLQFYDVSLREKSLWLPLATATFESVYLKLSTPPIRAQYYIQILEALAFCHSKGIWHCDVKPGNILVMKDNSLLLGDFSLSCVASKSQKIPKSSVGTFPWKAPEDYRISETSDLWSVGIMLICSIYGANIFYNYEKVVDKLLKTSAWLSRIDNPTEKEILTGTIRLEGRLSAAALLGLYGKTNNPTFNIEKIKNHRSLRGCHPYFLKKEKYIPRSLRNRVFYQICKGVDIGVSVFTVLRIFEFIDDYFWEIVSENEDPTFTTVLPYAQAITSILISIYDNSATCAVLNNYHSHIIKVFTFYGYDMSHLDYTIYQAENACPKKKHKRRLIYFRASDELGTRDLSDIIMTARLPLCDLSYTERCAMLSCCSYPNYQSSHLHL